MRWQGPNLVSLLVLEDVVEVCGSSYRVATGISWVLEEDSCGDWQLVVASMYIRSSTNFQLVWRLHSGVTVIVIKTGSLRVPQALSEQSFAPLPRRYQHPLPNTLSQSLKMLSLPSKASACW